MNAHKKLGFVGLVAYPSFFLFLLSLFFLFSFGCALFVDDEPSPYVSGKGVADEERNQLPLDELGYGNVGYVPQNVEDISVRNPEGVEFYVVARGLEIPWELVFLEDGSMLVSERPGRIKRIVNGQVKFTLVIDEVEHIGEGGLMGMAVSPKTGSIYVMYTYRDESGNLWSRVRRVVMEGEKLKLDKVILDRIPAGVYHNGGRLRFGPDGKLYITTGELFKGELAQNLNSLNGKILRINEDGSIPPDNPFSTAVWSYGHRNPQGLAFHPTEGTLFSSEHGPSGEFGLRAWDEVNVIFKGGNYGWPYFVGASGRPDLIDPIVAWSPPNTTPPAGMDFLTPKDLFIATLRSQALIRIVVEKGEGTEWLVKKIERWFEGVFGRLRSVVKGPDGNLYILTSNRDGRGTPREGDDKIIKLVIKKLEY